MDVGKHTSTSRKIVHETAAAFTIIPNLPRLKYRFGRTLSRPRYRRIACGITQEVCVNMIVALTIAEKAVVEPKNINPYS